MSIVPCLWFESEAVEAVDFYVGLLPDSRVTGSMEGPPGQPPISVDFELQGQRMLALNGRPADQPGFTDAMSLQVEVDPDLLGGLVVRVGNEVIDGSVAGRLATARRQLPK